MRYDNPLRAPLAIATMLTAERTHSRRRRRRRIVSRAAPRLGRRARSRSQNESRERRPRLGRPVRPARPRRRRRARARVSARPDRRAAHATGSLDAARHAVARLDRCATAGRRSRSGGMASSFAQLPRCRRAARRFSAKRISQLALDLSACRRTAGASSRRCSSSPPRVSTVRMLAQRLDVLAEHVDEPILSRAACRRRSNISPRARLVRAARLFENPGFSVANVANHLDYSSPQSFGRHVRTIMRLTAVRVPRPIRRRRHAPALPADARSAASRAAARAPPAQSIVGRELRQERRAITGRAVFGRVNREYAERSRTRSSARRPRGHPPRAPRDRPLRGRRAPAHPGRSRRPREPPPPPCAPTRPS